jgi:hypothetical protein
LIKAPVPGRLLAFILASLHLFSFTNSCLLSGFWTKAWDPRMPDSCLFSSPLAIEPNDSDQRGCRHRHDHSRHLHVLLTFCPSLTCLSALCCRNICVDDREFEGTFFTSHAALSKGILRTAREAQDDVCAQRSNVAW